MTTVRHPNHVDSNPGRQSAMATPPDAIGGYYAMALPPEYALPDKHYGYQSARAALAALLLQRDVARIHLPYFLCDSIREELERVGIEISRYRLASDLSPAGPKDVGDDEAILLVNYFGVCAGQINQALQRLPRHRCVVDNSQALGTPAADCMGTIYSPRKFFGLPDGGILVTDHRINLPERIDSTSHKRCEHLLLRHDQLPKHGLAAFRRAEDSLSGMAHQQMSRLTRRLLAGIDRESAFERRRANFAAAHSLFQTVNQFPLDSAITGSPLTYPLMLDVPAVQIKEILVTHRIFCPTYWPEASGCADALARMLSSNILHIPIDQRYTPQQLKQRLDAIPALRELLIN